MNNYKIQRINELARKAKKEGLSESEKTEQEKLRREYIDACKNNLRTTLESLKNNNESEH